MSTVNKHFNTLLEEYLAGKKGFEYVEKAPNKSIKYEKGTVLLVPFAGVNYAYTILGFMRYNTGYLRYVGELKNPEGNVLQITSRDIRQVDKDYKLSLTSILKEL